MIIRFDFFLRWGLCWSNRDVHSTREVRTYVVTERQELSQHERRKLGEREPRLGNNIVGPSRPQIARACQLLVT